jgi:hypothetical protein
MPCSYSPPSFILQSPQHISTPPASRFSLAGKGPHEERCLYLKPFLTYPPRSPVKELPPPRGPLPTERCPTPTGPLIHLSKFPVDKPSSRFSKQGPHGKRSLSPEPFLPNLQGPQHESPPSRFPSQSSLRERCPTFRDPCKHISKSLVDEPTLGCPTEPHWRQSLSQSLPFLTFRAPKQRSLPLQVPLTEPP